MTASLSRRFSQIYPTDQSVSSYSSNPSTPVSSPPPLTGSAPGWAPGAAPVSPHFTADPNRGIHMVCIEVLFYIPTITNYDDLTARHKLQDPFNVVSSQIILPIYCNIYLGLIFAICGNLSRYNRSNIAERFLGRVYNFGRFGTTHGIICFTFTSAGTLQPHFFRYFAVFTLMRHINDIINYTRAIMFFLGRGEDCYEHKEERYTSGSKETEDVVCSCVCRRFIFYYEKLRLFAILAHNHAALKLHRVHDRVCTERNHRLCASPYERLFIYNIYILPFAPPHLRKNY